MIDVLSEQAASGSDQRGTKGACLLLRPALFHDARLLEAKTCYCQPRIW